MVLRMLLLYISMTISVLHILGGQYFNFILFLQVNAIKRVVRVTDTLSVEGRSHVISLWLGSWGQKENQYKRILNSK